MTVRSMDNGMPGRAELRLGLGEDELQFKASVERLLARDYGVERRRVALANGGFDPDFWQQLAELGWLGACFPEPLGGYGQSANEALILLEQFGRALVLEPLLGAVLVPGAALLAGGRADAHGALIDGLIAGERRLALAWSEQGRRGARRPRLTSAVRDQRGWCVNGVKQTVLNAPLADTLLVSAIAGEDSVLLLVPHDAPGVSLIEYTTIDGQPAADLRFTNVVLPDDALAAGPERCERAMDAAMNWGAAGACAEALGAMDAALELTLEYTGTRQQFGQKLSGFQVIQHRLAAMATELEYSQALLPLLAAHLDGNGADRSAQIAGIRARIVGSARCVVADAVQLHGGIGVTDEAAISHYFRRVTALEQAWGSARQNLERYRQGRQGYDPLRLQ